MCRSARFVRRARLVLCGAIVATACGDGPVTPNTLAPVMVCPTPITAQSPDGNPVTVVFDPPQIIAGQPPLVISCTPKSETPFGVGTTNVTCTVSDSALRTNACTFAVTVQPAPRLTATRFLAFGNSITEGKNAFGQVQNTYPVQLRAMLVSRYSTQASAITIVNGGLGGEETARGAARLPGVLDAVNPEVLLLEEGINDLNGGASRIAPMINALEDMVRQAKFRKVQVFLATLLPVREGSPKNDASAIIPAANEQIRQLAARHSIVLVDLYAGFGGSPDPFIDVDGLHPTEQGYGKIAEIFLASIRTQLESAVMPASFELVRNMPMPILPIASRR